ncbi:hypothetical protein [cf. Phormidesmis sp. LEGE 11477]|uniref:hypothetical protein n=1 Tax=cf. Phormidesmis sp. LEGE 11477 TaxID=1828680 RepID=UPI001881FE3A|nr:hypothetical protein [cf. Phormidesmis sp. LEGE 11477]MBE9064845.1 hypothetical protein [cf. Phormidesmis sp. LEGE 11477]
MLEKRVHANTLNYYSVPDGAEIYSAAPLDLMNGARLDVLARYVYARAKLSGIGVAWAQFCYGSMLNGQTNGFARAGEYDPGKSGLSDYIEQFDRLIESMRARGFAIDELVIPTCDGTIVDGAHRVASAVALGLESIQCVELAGARMVQNYQSLTRNGVPESVIESQVLELIRLKPKSRIALLFPCVGTRSSQAAVTKFQECFDVDYVQNTPVSMNALINLMHLSYGHHDDWWSDHHARSFAKNRYRAAGELSVVAFQEQGRDVRGFKDALRVDLGKDNDGLHTTDTHEETLLLAETLFNANGRHWLSFADLSGAKTPRFDRFLQRFGNVTTQAGAADRVAVDSGGVLAAYGLRDVSDLDYLEAGGEGSFDEGGDINWHNAKYDVVDGLDAEAIVSDPRNHFYFHGVKFAAFHVVQSLKEARNTEKDLKDFLAMKRAEKSTIGDDLWVYLRTTRLVIQRRIRQGFISLFHITTRLMKRRLPDAIYLHIRRLYRALFKKS